MIELWSISDALRPRVGSALAEDEGLCQGAVEILRGYAPYRDTFAGMSARVEDYLFNALYDRLGSGMSARMDDGTFRRIHMAELPDCADAVMGVLFDSLKVYSVNYEALHSYCMESGSFSALKALYLRFEELTPSPERRVIIRIIRNNYPRERWESWMKEED